jgi:hypothetical protein
MRKAEARASLKEQFRDTELAALESWRSMVRNHAAGGAVDLAEIARLAALIGVRDAATAFSMDADATLALRDIERRLAEERAALTEAAQVAAEAEAALWPARQEVARLERLIAMPPIAAHGVAALNARRRETMASAPRMFVEATASDASVTGKPVPLALAWGSRKATGSVAGEATWEDDGQEQ